MPVLPRLLSLGALFDRLDDAAATDLADAREALAYWRRREAGLAWHRRAARAEARDHIARWHGHIERAQLERWGLERSHPLAPLVGALALPRREQARRLGALAARSGPVRWAGRLVLTATILCVAAFAAMALLVSSLL